MVSAATLGVAVLSQALLPLMAVANLLPPGPKTQQPAKSAGDPCNRDALSQQEVRECEELQAVAVLPVCVAMAAGFGLCFIAVAAWRLLVAREREADATHAAAAKIAVLRDSMEAARV